MRKRIGVVLALLGLALSPVLLAGPTSAADGPTHSVTISGDASGNMSTVVDGKQTSPARILAGDPYNYYRFGFNYICQDDDIGNGSYYPTITAGNQFEYGQSNVVLANDNNETITNCYNYTAPQTLRYTLFSGDTSICIKVSGNYRTLSDGWNEWSSVVQAQINRNCDIYGAQWRANMTSRVTGLALGLATYSDSNETGCVMNFDHAREYWYAGICDQNRLHWIPTY